MRTIVPALLAGLVLCQTHDTVQARQQRSTHTDVCIGQFCADVTRIKYSGNPQQVFIEVVVRRSPASDFVNMRCENGHQVRNLVIFCPGRSVAVQACSKPVIGRSRCGAWVIYR